MDALVVAPMASHGFGQGNSTRVRTFCMALQRLGARVHFVYHALDGTPPAAIDEMCAAWDSVEIVRPQPVRKLGGRPHYALDDWCGEELMSAIASKTRRKRYDLWIANYVWLSRVLTLAPDDAVRMIDTHDVFSGRDERARAHGLEPNWYWTTAADEARGLARADMVIAIQDREAEVLQGLSPSLRVRTVGHLGDAAFQAPARRSSRLKVGHLASANPWNTKTIVEFVKKAVQIPGFAEAVELVFAGPICQALMEMSDKVTLLGHVSSVEAFYRRLDLVVNPTGAGTGLKIKSVEALQHGMALVAVRDAMTGIRTSLPEHALASHDEVIQCLVRLGAAPDLVPALREACRTCFHDYRVEQVSALREAVGDAQAMRRSQPQLT